MSEATLTVQRRSETGSRPAGRYRRQGLVPAVVYGLGTDTLAVTVDAHALQRILSGGSGMNTLITLQIDGEDQLALARQIQRNPVKSTLLHVDFIRVRADQTIAAEIPVHLEGESEGAQRGGVMEQALFTVSIEALPTNLPPEITFDVSALEIGDQAHVRDLVAPEGVEITTVADELVVQIVAPRVVEEEAPAEGAEEGVEAATPAEGGEAEAASE
ncbi:MAG: 50S ribosomal protein L25 [Actinomycetota bacterium]